MSASQYRFVSGLLVGAVAIGLSAPTAGQERGRQAIQVSGVFKAADLAAGTITVTMTSGDGRRTGELREPVTMDKAFALAKDVEIVAGGRGGVSSARGNGGLFREVKLADLSSGINVALTLSADEKTVVSVLAEGPMVRGRIKSVEADKNSVTILLPGRGGRERGEPAAADEKSYTVATDAEIAVDEGRGGRFSIKEARLTDLAQGALVTARLSVDLKQIQFLVAEGPSYQGTIKAIDPAKNTLILVVRPARGDDAGEEQALTLPNDAAVLLDDGKGRRLSLKEGKIADVPVGAAATVRLSVNQALVTQLRVEGPTLIGQLKSVDADKGTIVVAMPRGRGEDPEEKSLTLAKDARINVEGTDSSLANLKVGENPLMVSVRLSLDQKTVQAVVARQSRSR
jgi:hypothetical protein